MYCIGILCHIQTVPHLLSCSHATILPAHARTHAATIAPRQCPLPPKTHTHTCTCTQVWAKPMNLQQQRRMAVSWADSLEDRSVGMCTRSCMPGSAFRDSCNVSGFGHLPEDAPARIDGRTASLPLSAHSRGIIRPLSSKQRNSGGTMETSATLGPTTIGEVETSLAPSGSSPSTGLHPQPWHADRRVPEDTYSFTAASKADVDVGTPEMDTISQVWR